MKFRFIGTGLFLIILLYSCIRKHRPSYDTKEIVTEKVPVVDEPLKIAIKGQVVFEQKCASCHGADGTAGIGNSANLQTSKLENDLIRQIITDGKGGMPSFNTQLNKEEIADLSSYVIALRK